jgi:hypothetical protein
VHQPATPDFNTRSVVASVTEHLHATGDIERVRQPNGQPWLLDLLADKDPHRFGTHYFHGHWFIFDQIVVSPGLLDDQGWSCDPATAQTVRTLARREDKQHRPWRFGNEHDKFERGYSDHFPVTVELRVNPN